MGESKFYLCKPDGWVGGKCIEFLGVHSFCMIPSSSGHGVGGGDDGAHSKS